MNRNNGVDRGTWNKRLKRPSGQLLLTVVLLAIYLAIAGPLTDVLPIPTGAAWLDVVLPLGLTAFAFGFILRRFLKSARRSP